jgi:serine/threonine-protein kinase
MTDVTDQLEVALVDRYLIEKEIGEGGMATVYLAHDVKHDRKVALKVLRPELAAVIGAERFLQEIKVTANLQHPHILPLHDSGAADSFLYYVMPFVDGETLRDKLDREKQLSIEDAVKICESVAAALDYAHRQDVVHRDVKPENILLHDGQALVADFGIALAISQAGTSRMTETGLSIGTPHYMSPEQAMGDRELDARSDIYSLGAMLYEMLAGDPPYQGSTAQAIVAKVITEKAPPVTAARDTVPNNIAAAITKALEKLPADRFHTAAEFASALSNPAFALPTSVRGVVEAVAAPPSRLLGQRVLLGMVLVLTVVAGWGWFGRRIDFPTAQPTRFTLDLGNASISTGAGFLLAVAPGGERIALVGQGTAGRQLFLRQAADLEILPVPGTSNAGMPSFSPDGDWLAFTADGDIKRVPIAGGSPLSVAQDVSPWGIHWGDNGDIIFRNQDIDYSVGVVRASGGTPRYVAGTDSSASTYRWPHMLPGGEAALITMWTGSNSTASIATMDLATGDIEIIVREGTNPRYVATGHIVYGHASGTIFGVPFDVSTRQVTGDPVPLLEDVQVFSGGATQLAVSPAGAIAYVQGQRGMLELVSIDLLGNSHPLAAARGVFVSPRFSPDGQRIAVQLTTEGRDEHDIYVQHVASGTLQRLTFEGDNDRPSWSLDGGSVLFSSDRDGVRRMYQKSIDQSVSAVPLTSGEAQLAAVRAPDGGLLVVEGGSTLDITLWPSGDTTSVPYQASGNWHEFAPAVSPDGRWVAYASTETGATQVFLSAYPEPTGRQQISQSGGAEPVWSPDGDVIYYWSGEEFKAARVQTEPSLGVVSSEVLFNGAYWRDGFRAYDIHPSGEYFVMLDLGEAAGAWVLVVVNWFDELRERMGN